MNPEFYLLLGLSSLAFAILTYFTSQFSYFPFDLSLALSVQRVNHPLFNLLMVVLSKLGSLNYILVILPLTAALFFIFHKRKSALFLIISSVGALLLGQFFKTLVLRPRPDPNLINQIEVYERADSFPSGHVLFYMGFYGFLLFLVYTQMRRSIIRTVSLVILHTVLVLIGVSRIYLGAHWFSDTLGSYFLGTVWILGMAYLYRNITNKE